MFLHRRVYSAPTFTGWCANATAERTGALNQTPHFASCKYVCIVFLQNVWTCRAPPPTTGPPPPTSGVKFAMIREGSESAEVPGKLEANIAHSPHLPLLPIVIHFSSLRTPRPSLGQLTRPQLDGDNDQLRNKREQNSKREPSSQPGQIMELNK